MEKIKTLINKDNLVVVGVVHDLNLAAKYGDMIKILHQGKILDRGTKELVLTGENINKVFRVKADIQSDERGLHLLFT